MSLDEVEKKRYAATLLHNAHWLAIDSLYSIRRAKLNGAKLAGATELKKTAQAILEELE